MEASELHAVWELLSEEVSFDWRKKQPSEDIGKVFLKQGEQQVEGLMLEGATHVKNTGKNTTVDDFVQQVAE